MGVSLCYEKNRLSSLIFRQLTVPDFGKSKIMFFAKFHNSENRQEKTKKPIVPLLPILSVVASENLSI